ncbi:MAG: glycosyltransferase family 4 protein [Alphaproteobacteria bacterium]|nr:glycosyltransferase family 4 protein [Alphaproteobacteria bacterium]
MSKSLLFIVNHMDCFWTRRFPIAKQAITPEEGWDVSVCASGADSDDRLSDYGFKGLGLPEPSRAHVIVSNVKIMLVMLRVIRAQKPDLIHAMTLKYAFMTGLVCLFVPRVKVVHTIAGLGYLFSGEGFKPKLLRFLIGPFLTLALRNKRSFLTFQNPDDMRVMIEGGYVHADQSTLIKGSGIDLDEYAFTPEPQSDKPLVVMPTRLIHEKGIKVFIDACNILTQRGIDADFQIAGGGAPYNPREISTDAMHAMLEGSNVTWLGHVSDIVGLYRKCNLVVYPSYYGEGVPKVLLEAAATGRAIITTDHAGCREAIIDAESGILVPIKDSEATADAMATLIQNATLRNTMGHAAREFAAAEYDVNSVVERTLRVYDVAMKAQ